MAILTVSNVSHRFGLHDVLHRVDVALTEGEFVGLIGPNGAGKSTLMRIMAGLLTPTAGAVYFQDRPLSMFHSKMRARHIAFVSQSPRMSFGFTVGDVVSMGRYAYLKRFATFSDEDRQMIDEAMERAGVSHLVERRIDALSGGERQRVFIARAMAQQPQLLFLDEPTAHLDIRYQLDILELVEKLNVRDRLTIVMAIHDLNLALRFCNRIVVLSKGEVVADGPPSDVLSERVIQDVFQVDAHIERDPETGMPVRVDYALRRSQFPQSDVVIDDGPL